MESISHTCELQHETERNCRDQREHWRKRHSDCILLSNKHTSFAFKGLLGLSSSFETLEASQTWIVYWIVHSLDLMGVLPVEIAPKVVRAIVRCQHPTGGFGGGPGQLAHLASTYAAIHTLIIIGNIYPKAYDAVDRKRLYDFLMSMRQSDGSFRMHEDGEVDIRGVYCAIASASSVNIITPALIEGTGEWIARCQTHEGGIGGNPHNEAHGGYTYCGLAAATILGSTNLLDLDGILRWSCARQMSEEGGFQGRSNKLVDACYSWWVGAVFPILSALSSSSPNAWSLCSMDASEVSNVLSFDVKGLREYLLECCQNPSGGLIDKPGKWPDFYHTCYALSGLAMTQSVTVGDYNPHRASTETNHFPMPLRGPIDAVYNVCSDSLLSSKKYYSNL